MSQRFFPDAAAASGLAAPPAEGGTSAEAARNVEHPEGLLAGAGGAEIYWQAWLPSGEPRAVVVIAHGIGEHSGRYGHVATRLNAVGFAAYALDHRGHGRSSGPRALIDRMDNAVEDVDSLVSLAATRHAGRPLHLLGHSMGGAIAIAYALRHQERLRGLLLSSAAASLGSAGPSTRLEAKALGAVAPTAGIMEIDPSLISHDPAVVRAYREDPLVYQGKLPARTVAEIAATIEGFSAGVPSLRVPLLVMAGTGDRIVPPSGSRMVNERAGSPDRTLRLYGGLYHELFNEPERRVVLGDVTAWLDARTVPQHVEAQSLSA
jgi:alpha-beta hydrolase superfamily lysophospholipase